MIKPPDYAWHTSLPWQPESAQQRKIARQLPIVDDLSVSIGGIGAGTISRGVNGGFTRWSIKAGQRHAFEQAENGFSFWQQDCPARSLRSAPGDSRLKWHFDPTGHHAALYPKVWHSYTDAPVELVIEQLTPIAPELMTDCDMPVGVFRVHLKNTASESKAAAVMFSFRNLVGWFKGFGEPGMADGVAGQTNSSIDDARLAGVVMTRETIPSNQIDEGEGQMVIAVARDSKLELSQCVSFDSHREGDTLWHQFATDGRLSEVGDHWTSGGGFSEFPAASPCAAISARTLLNAGETRTIDFVLSWDLPVIQFGQGRRHYRHYTARFGNLGNDAVDIARCAIDNASRWSAAIDQFHTTVNKQLSVPAEVTALLINELYFLTDGLTVWTDDNLAGLIECPDYPLYNTLDLWVYASAAIADHFPGLSQAINSLYCSEVNRTDNQIRFHLKSNQRFPRQRAGMLPHDTGAPNGDPFVRANDYVYQDSSQWKDLNAMFVLCCWRDVRIDSKLASHYLPFVTTAMHALAEFDRDNDGLIENDGIPDQTFDNVPMLGVSAYCGGLWLAAMRATAKMAELAGNIDQHHFWENKSTIAEPLFVEKLWNGNYFNIDTDSDYREALFSEQLFGPAQARMLGLGDCVPNSMARKALLHIYNENFIKAGKRRGTMAVTSSVHSSEAYAPAGEAGLQWDEILVGFNYSFACALEAYGLNDECTTLLTALAHELGPVRGLHFQTPAAIVADQPLFRAQMNMRPLGIWALLDATINQELCDNQSEGFGNSTSRR